MISSEVLEGVPLLVLANKQDVAVGLYNPVWDCFEKKSNHALYKLKYDKACCQQKLFGL